MRIFSKLSAVNMVLAASFPAIARHSHGEVDVSSKSKLPIEDTYDEMADKIQSAVFPSLELNEVSLKQLDRVSSNVNFVISRFGNQNTTDDIARFKDDKFSKILRAVFLDSFIEQVISEDNKDMNPAIILYISDVYDASFKSAYKHGKLPTAFPFLFASDRLSTLLRQINYTSSLERGADVDSIINTLAMIRELFEDVNIDSAFPESFISSLVEHRNKFLKSCEEFFAIIPEEYSSMYPHIVIDALNAFKMLESMTKMLVAILTLPDKNLSKADSIAEMVKALNAHLIIGCVKRSVPTDVLVEALKAGPKSYLSRIFSSIKGFFSPAYNYPQDVYPDHPVPLSITKPATSLMVVDTPVDSPQEEEVPLLVIEDCTLVETVVVPESVPKDSEEKPDKTLRNLVLGLLALSAGAALVYALVYFLRKRFYD